MLKHGTKVVQDPRNCTSVRLENGEAMDGRTLLCQMNGDQGTRPEREEDCQTVAVAINAYLSPPTRYAVLCIPKVGPTDEQRFRVYSIQDEHSAAKCYRNNLVSQGFETCVVEFTTVDALAAILMG